MATIKIRRGSGQPAIGGSGLTAYEPAWDTVNNRFFINNGSTAMWIGAAVIQDTTLAGNCTWTIPTQNSVKTYVDNQVAAGAVTSVNGATGAVTIAGGTGISILTSAAARGVTIFNAGVLSINGNTGTVSNVAFTNTTNSFSALQTFTSGIAVTAGMTLSDTLRVRGSLVDPGGKIELWDENNTFKVTLSTELITAKDSTFYFGGADGHVVAADTDGATSGWIVKANGAGLAPTWINPAASGFSAFQSDRTDRLLIADAVSNTYYFDLSGGKTGYQLHYSSNNMTWNETGSRLSAPNIVATSGITTGNLTFTGTILGNVVTSVNGVTGAVTNVASLNGATGTVTIGGGTGIAIATSIAARGITVTNVGVVGLTGTANQITVSGTTGSITLTLPSAITAPGSLTTTSSLLVGTDATITGNLTVNGTTTTVNSTTVTVQDPLIAIGGITGNAPPPVGDTKDRGIVFQWATGVTGQTGFFGFDQSTQRFTFMPSSVSVSGEVVTGAAGNAEFLGVYAPSGTLTLQGVSGANATITLAGNTAGGSTVITNTAFETLLTSSTGVGRLSLRSDLIDTTLKGTFVPTTLTAARSYTLPDISGQMVLADTAGATTGWLLRGQGSATQNTWINPNAAGFTAFTTTNINLVSVKDAVNYGLVFALGTAGNQILYGDSTTGVRWQPSTNTLTVGAGLGFFEGIVEGGTF